MNLPNINLSSLVVYPCGTQNVEHSEVHRGIPANSNNMTLQQLAKLNENQR